MPHLTLITTLLFIVSLSYSQNVLDYKKKNKIIHRFWKGETIAFQTSDKEWQKGELIQIQNDSIYMRPWILRPNMAAPGGADTLRYAVTGYSLSDIDAMPKRGVLIHYANGHYEIAMDGGHQHFYWTKSGWLFRIGAAGYAALHVINGIIKNDLSLSNSAGPLGIAAGAFGFGILLKKTYKLTHRLGRRYHLEVFSLSRETKLINKSF